jgi:hypothetical protein
MPQTLLALLALTLSSVLVLNQQRMTTQGRQQMLSDEVELAASGLASDIMEMIGARSFDERSTPDAILALQYVPAVNRDFSSATSIGAADRGRDGCNLLVPNETPECDDVDDVAGLGWQPVEVELAHRRTLPFDVRVSVHYVTDPGSMVVSTEPTLHKRVTVDLRSRFLTSDGTNGNVSITRVMSYDPVKATLDFERLYGPMGVMDPPETGGWVPTAP